MRVACDSGNYSGIELENAAIKAMAQIKDSKKPGEYLWMLYGHNCFQVCQYLSSFLIVSIVFGQSSAYSNFTIGVWWNRPNLLIFNQPLAAMPAGTTFSLIVIKQ